MVGVKSNGKCLKELLENFLGIFLVILVYDLYTATSTGCFPTAFEIYTTFLAAIVGALGFMGFNKYKEHKK